MPESLGPHFFCRLFKEEGNNGGSGYQDAAYCEKYLLELSATGLGHLGTDNTKEDQRWKIGSATLSIANAHFQKPRDNNKSCTVEQLNVRTGDAVIDMGAFASTLRRIQSLCARGRIGHLAIRDLGGPGSGLLKYAGFKVCDCEPLCNNVSAPSRMCMELSIPTGPLPRVKEGDNPMSVLSVRERDNRAAVASNTQRTANADIEGSRFGKKKHCMHWILRGECAYMQSGCRYEHEIPVDQKTRDEIGMGDIPQWFKDSRYWRPWLEKVEASKREELADDGGNKNTFTVQGSSSRSDRRAPHVSWRGEGSPPTTTRGPVTIGPYTVESPHHIFHQNTLATKIKEELSPAGPSLATTMDSTNDIRRRPDREIYQPPGAFLPGPAVKREDPWTDESSEISSGYLGDPSRGWAKRRRLSEWRPYERNR